MQVHYVLLPAADAPDVTVYDVYSASQQIVETPLSDVAHACGIFSLPAARENFTLTLTAAADTAECREYAEASGNALDAWAARHRCSRCPSLLPETEYKACIAPVPLVCMQTAQHPLPTILFHCGPDVCRRLVACGNLVRNSSACNAS